MKNLKRFFILFLSGFGLITIFQFCENAITEIDERNEFVNPYDYVGEMHNEGLNFVLTNVVLQKGVEMDIKNICDLTSQYMITNYKGEGQDLKLYRDLTEHYLGNFKKGNDSIVISEFFRAGTKGQKLYLKIKDVFRTIDFNDTLPSFLAVKKIEKEIWKSNITENEKIVLLAYSSVEKHSFSYWKGNLSKYSGLKATKSEDEWREFVLWLLERDGEGAIVGFIIGLIKGGIEGTIIVPGAGTVTAAIAEGISGAIYGAIIDSAVSLFIKYVVPLI